MDITDTMRAFQEGYELGVRYAKQYFGTRRINIKYTPSCEQLRMVELDCGGLLNLGGRSLPF